MIVDDMYREISHMLFETFFCFGMSLLLLEKINETSSSNHFCWVVQLDTTFQTYFGFYHQSPDHWGWYVTSVVLLFQIENWSTLYVEVRRTGKTRRSRHSSTFCTYLLKSSKKDIISYLPYPSSVLNNENRSRPKGGWEPIKKRVLRTPPPTKRGCHKLICPSFILFDTD